MAVENKDKAIASFDDWYDHVKIDPYKDSYANVTVSKCGIDLIRKAESYQREMNSRVANYHKLLKLANAEVITTHADLPNVSSGEASGMVLRMARNLVQNTPNVEVVSSLPRDTPAGILSEFILRSKVIGDESYSNDMQQNLFASTKNAITLGFDCVIPILVNSPTGYYIKYDNIFYQDVFPEPSAKDIREANDVFVRRYLSKGDVKALLDGPAQGWDDKALRTLLENKPGPWNAASIDNERSTHNSRPDGYEIITYYSTGGDSFLTFDVRHQLLLRIEKNKHPLKSHPVFFLILEKDLNQPLGKSQIERILGRQEFQDLMLNGAFKTYYRNINPTIISYGAVNASLNLGPGKLNQINNPNARLETFEVSTQTLMQFNSISQANAGNMVQQVGAADQQMASQNTGGAMSQTPQGVEAQQQMVDITTNNYQKAIELFFSHYCSYGITMYFHELKNAKKITVTADAREKLLRLKFDEDKIDQEDGSIEIDFKEMAVEYWVRTVPGSLVEMENEKESRLLNEMFIPLSQALPAIVQTGNPEVVTRSVDAMVYIIEKQLALSGSKHSKELQDIMTKGRTEEFTRDTDMIMAMEGRLGEIDGALNSENTQILEALQAQASQLSMLTEVVTAMQGGSNPSEEEVMVGL